MTICLGVRNVVNFVSHMGSNGTLMKKSMHASAVHVNGFFGGTLQSWKNILTFTDGTVTSLTLLSRSFRSKLLASNSEDEAVSSVLLLSCLRTGNMMAIAIFVVSFETAMLG